jgi:RNA polymerase sigma factor (sigma-70 family)
LAGETLGEVIRRLGRSGGLQDDLAQTDAQLLVRFARRRDDAAFAALMARHGPMVLGLCRRLLPDAHDAEDAFQAAFLVLARKAGAIPRNAPLGPWLYGVAWRVALRLRSRSARRHMHELNGVDLEARGEDDPAWSEALPLVQEEVRRLPEKYRAVVVLCCLQEKSNEEAATLLRRPVGTVKSRLARARDLLRSRLARRGLAVSVGLLASLLAVRAARASASLVQAALEAAPRFAARDHLTGGASARAARLARGVLRAAFLTKLAVVAAGALAICLLAVGVWLAWSRSRPAAAAVTGDARAIQGVWATTGLIDFSLLFPPPDPELEKKMVELKWRITADTLVIHHEGEQDIQVHYKLDSTTNPKTMSLTWPDGSASTATYTLYHDTLTIMIPSPLKPDQLHGLELRQGDPRVGFQLRPEK